MKVYVAENAGFCFGVERAVNGVYDLLSKSRGKIYTLGSLIHNPTINEDLAKNNVVTIDENDLDTVFSEANEQNDTTVVIRAHGITKELYEKLEGFTQTNKYFHYLDCTCPYVKKIHKIVVENTTPDNTLVIFGDPNHPEVRGIESFSKGEKIIFRELNEDLFNQIAQKSVVVVSQTTQNLTEWKKTQKFIKKHCTNPLIFDTICNVTEKRQTETEKLAEKVDFMIIIGGRNSSNTNKLFSVASKVQPNTILVENASEIPFDTLKRNITVGISAGASTPGSIIEEVKSIMSELNLNPAEENFAELLDQSFKTLHTGEIVKCTVLSVNSNEVQVDLGAKVTGFIPYSEFGDDVDLEKAVKVGDEVEAKITKMNDAEGYAMLSKKSVDAMKYWDSVVEAKENGTVLEGKVTDVVKGGVLISVNATKLFVPASQTGISKGGDLSVLKGTTQKVKIIDIDSQKRRAVASIRVVLREERAAKAEEIWANIEEGKKYDGVVKSLTSYGAFVDLGGVDGMVHTTELSWTHIKHPSQVVSVGQKISVYVKSFDKEAKRISLGYKADEDDPWKIFTGKYAVGDVAEVKIANMLPFGAFAEIIPGVDGLIHISQIANKKLKAPSDVLEIGQVVNAEITDIDDEHRKVSLSIRKLLQEENEAEAEPEIEVEITEQPAEETAEAKDAE